MGKAPATPRKAWFRPERLKAAVDAMTQRNEWNGQMPCLALALLLVVLGCAPAEEEKTGTSSEVEKNSAVGPVGGNGGGGLLDIPIQFSSALLSPADAGLLLANPVQAYEIDLTDCASGRTARVTEADSGGLKVYRHDRGCLARLEGFTYAGKQYFPTTADPFTTWEVGDLAVFDETGEPGAAALKVRVLATLGETVAGADSIQFGIYAIISGQDRGILWSTLGTAAKIQPGVALEPSFSVASIELTGLSDDEGGEFRFVLECDAGIGITNECASVPFADIDYILVEDTYGGVLSEMDADGLFVSPGEVISLPDDRVAPGDAGTVNGGFVTTILEGPDNLADHPGMLLILRSYGDSYQYFPVSVQVNASY